MLIVATINAHFMTIVTDIPITRRESIFSMRTNTHTTMATAPAKTIHITSMKSMRVATITSIKFGE
jgi:hypothetical protein